MRTCTLRMTSIGHDTPAITPVRSVDKSCDANVG